MAEAGNVLKAIVDRKRQDVASRLGGFSLDELRRSVQPTRQSLRSALARPGARFIMEVKRASPSQGEIQSKVDPETIVSAYGGVADAISVLTDTPYFNGSLEDLARVRSVFDGPILAKDFIVDPRQVAEARQSGADAVLAMLSVLGPDEAAAVLAEARFLGMDAIVEVHDETQLQLALRLGAPIIGINNRDLRTLEVDLGVTERLAPMIPPERLVVAESGIGGRMDVERLAPRVDAFLVGTALMKASDPARAARDLVFGQVKVCGLTDPKDVVHAAAGASHGGMIFVPESARFVSAREAAQVAEEIKLAGLKSVGVFRNGKVMEVALTTRRLGLDVVQLHGNEDPDYFAALRNLLGGETEIWGVSAVRADEPRRRTGADRTLYDSVRGGRSGGTGEVFDWSRLPPAAALRSDVVAGGLSPANAAEAARLGAYALDVNSGVEQAPGKKDPEKLDAFFEALRPVARSELVSCA